MKLYTEEQVKESFKSGFRLAMETDGGLKEGQEEFINSITPIELPSDEDIDKASMVINKDGLSCENDFARDSFKEGAKWMKEQIKNQNK